MSKDLRIDKSRPLWLGCGRFEYYGDGPVYLLGNPPEAIIPSAHYWDGKQWQPETSAGIQYWPIVFESEQAARDYADAHDPEI